MNSNIKKNDKQDIYFPNIDELEQWSYKTSLNKSLKTSLSKIERELLFQDINLYLDFISNKIINVDKHITYRIKSLSSCKRKYKKNLLKGNSIQSAFNDILGIRIIVPSYDIDLPNYFRVVDMRNGKKKDDGYRGIHLYYKKDNYHYPIEIQLNTLADRVFADYAHIYAYKIYGDKTIKELRILYDNGIIHNEKDFVKELEVIINGE